MNRGMAASTPSPSVQVQGISDLHLEGFLQYSRFTIPATAPFPLLVGDIGKVDDYDHLP
jgi:hypothetical protein